MSAALNAYMKRPMPPFKRDAFSSADLNQVIMSKFIHICNMPPRPAVPIETPHYVTYDPRGNEIGPINGLTSAFARDFAFDATNTHCLSFTDADYRDGDDLSDLIGDTERQRLSVEIWNQRRQEHAPAILTLWHDRLYKIDIANDVARHFGDLSLLRTNEKRMAHAVREAIYRRRLVWGGEAAQFGAIKAHCIIATLVSMLPSDRNASLTLLDTSAGWGDRALGAATIATIGTYIGFDPNLTMHPSYRQIDALATHARATLKMPALNMTFVPLGFPLSNSDIQIADIVFTSPPYWDKEIYCRDGTQSTTQFTTFDAWFDGFYCAMLDYSLAHLRPGGIMAIHICDIARMTIVERMLRWCQSDGRSTFAGVLLLSSGQSTTKPVWLLRRV